MFGAMAFTMNGKKCLSVLQALREWVMYCGEVAWVACCFMFSWVGG